MKMRLLPTNEKGQLTGVVLEEAIRKDKEAGLIPCYCVATLGKHIYSIISVIITEK